MSRVDPFNWGFIKYSSNCTLEGLGASAEHIPFATVWQHWLQVQISLVTLCND